MKIQAPHIANLFHYASYKGISEYELRNYLIVKELDVCNANNSITKTEFLAIFKALMDLTSDSNFGLHYGCFLNIKALGFVTQLSLNATSIEQAIYILQNYLQNSFPIVSLTINKSYDHYALELESSIDNNILKNQVLDVAYCFIYRELKLMLPNDLMPILEIPHQNSNEYNKFLNVKIHQGKKYSFIFKISILSAQINKKTAGEIELLLPKFLQMLDIKKSGYESFSIQVRNMVLNMCCPELPNFEQVAIHFPLSNRTIQRKLKNEGLTFREITDDIKSELSDYLIKGNKMRTQDIAYILGYSESSSYLHAVKKWKKSLQV